MKNMTTLEKIEQIDKWMLEYNVTDVYSLLEKMNCKNNEYISDLEQQVKDYKNLFDMLKIKQYLLNIDIESIRCIVNKNLQTSKDEVILKFDLRV